MRSPSAQDDDRPVRAEAARRRSALWRWTGARGARQAGRRLSPAQLCLTHPRAFAWRVLRGFRANQGLLLAGAVAYYALLSIVPLLILSVIALSHVLPEGEVLETVGRYLGWLLPGRGKAIVSELSDFLEHKEVVGWLLLVTMLFFSTLAFTVLESAMSVIFVHRVTARRRPLVASLLLPYVYIVCLGLGLLVVTIVAGGLQELGQHTIDFIGHHWSLDKLSRAMLYLVGLAGEVVLLTSVYLVMPVGQLAVRHALIGGLAAAALWEITRRLLVWYFATLSQVNVVYGSMTTAIVVLLSLELGATLLLLGAQVISEYERLSRHEGRPPPADLVIRRAGA
jgi:YihY family inner membrane protein